MQRGGPVAIRPALTWAGRSPTSCRGKVPTGCSGETRIEEEQPEAMLNALKIPRGATVADVGTGAGYHSIRLGRHVGPKGMVYATDVQPEMLRMLRENARAAGVANIKPVRCTQNDPGLPKEAIDLILMVNVYHECSDPEATLQGLRAALKPQGRLVLVEFRGEDPEVPIKPEHKMTLAQVRLEVEPQGFTFKESLEFLPWQHVIIFEKPAAPKTKADRATRKRPRRIGNRTVELQRFTLGSYTRRMLKGNPPHPWPGRETVEVPPGLRGVSLQGFAGSDFVVRRTGGVGLPWVQFPPGNWVAPAGSYRSGGGGNEAVGAFETHVSLWRCSEQTGRNASER